MAINTKELQKFLDIWSPIIAALPAVISATERENELETHVPILQSQLEKVQADTLEVLAAKATQIEAVNADIQALQVKKEAALQEVRTCKEDCKAEINAARLDANLAIKGHLARAKQVQASADEASEALRVRLMESDKAFLAHTNEQQAIVDALEAKRKAVEASIDALRNKLV
jgi:hypothetical protein